GGCRLDDRSQKKESTFIGKAARKGQSLLLLFLLRFALWTTLIGLLASFVSSAIWSQVYDQFGLPLSIGRASVYQAVLFGAAVASVMGGAAVAFVGMFRR